MTYQHILVPLNQSDLAEQALDHALALAQALHSRLTLISVISIEGDEEERTVDWEAEASSYREYLRGVAGRLADSVSDITTEVLAGDAGSEILRYAEEQGCDLIVMATHARTGLGRWVHGSVADQILNSTPVPILMVRAVE
jgi:nucleotide-binding universal stress UspA family protein